jgi:hypothetical protein
MVKEKNPAANSVKTCKIKPFNTISCASTNHLTHNEAPWFFDIAVAGMFEHQRGL